MDKKSLIDKIAAKNSELHTLVSNAKKLKDQLSEASTMDEAEVLDKKLTENAKQTTIRTAEIEELQKKLKEMPSNMTVSNNKNNKKGYLATNAAVKDWVEILNSSSNNQDAKAKWEAKLAENGVTVGGDTSELPAMVDLGIQNAISENPVFDLFTKAPGGKLVYKKFETSQTAVTRGQAYNITEQKTEQESTLTVKALAPNQIYKMTSVDYRTLKEIGDQLAPFIASELSQFVIDKIVDLALYDGTGADDSNKTGGFDAVVNNPGAVQVSYKGSLADAIRNNAFRATGTGAVTVTQAGASNATTTTLIVNPADYANILGTATALNYNVSDIPSWLGVGQIIVKEFASEKYKPIVLKAGAYTVAYDDFDQFDWYNIMNNTNKTEVVALASGTLFEPNSAVVFTAEAKADAGK